MDVAKAMIRLILSLGLMMMVGCGSMSMVQNPLVDPNAPDDGSKLYGAYQHRLRDGTVQNFHLGFAGKSFPQNFMRLVMVGDHPETGLSSLEWPVFVKKVNDGYVLHVPLDKSLRILNSDKTTEVLKLPLDKWDIQGYVLFCVKVVPDGLRVASLNDDFLAEQVQQNHLQGQITSVDRPNTKYVVNVTTGRKQLESFVSQHFDKVFDSEFELLKMIDQP